jgi:hypothetical protein
LSTPNAPRGEQLASIPAVTDETKWDAARAVTAVLKAATPSGRVEDIDPADAAPILAMLDLDPAAMLGRAVKRAPKPPRTDENSINIRCPFCHVTAGIRCKSAAGYDLPNTHTDRKRAWKRSQDA